MLIGIMVSFDVKISITSHISTEFSIIHLKELNLGNNYFSEIPQSIFSLHNLKVLSFSNLLKGKSNNTIKFIPDEICSLENLENLDLYENPIENIPREIVSSGVDAIKNFIRSKKEADNEEFLYEAKMVVVGRGDVGKTVLTKKLTIPDYSLTHSETTQGINILKNPFNLPMTGLQGSESFKFNIWDFGGQEKYDTTHQLFITSRSVYLFLTEARDESNYQDVFYWLNTINLLSHDSPVIVVLSKIDERQKKLPESVYKNQFGNIVKFVDVSCANRYEHTIEGLKDAIKDAVMLLPQTKISFSNHWIEVRKELENLSQQKDYIDYYDYLSICEKNKLDKERANFLSEFLNDLGVIIHHQNDLLLKKTVFINTDWCVDGMYKVFDDKNVSQNNGKFSNADLKKIWEEDKRFESKQAELIKLMLDYNLCFELSDESGFIAPDLLPPDRPEILQWTLESALLFEYKYEFMPAGMLSRFIVKSHSFIKDNLFWKYGTVLTYDNTEALVEEDYINRKIKISLKGENKKGLLSAIRMFIEEIHRNLDKSKKLVFEEMIPCK
ncbi:hypothetical protein EZS27_032331 [termite gut metagenome]|uniref:Uncharacterized protein n=1 Tax=termite gut metagenome TaxID=433724 RepID=A0A5J4Q6Y7_9ZZZZ